MKKSFFQKMSVHRQLVFLFGITIVIVSIVFYAYNAHLQTKTIQESFQNYSKQTMKYISLGLKYGVEDDNYEMIGHVLNWGKDDEKIRFIGFFDEDGELIAKLPDDFNYNIEELEKNLDNLCLKDEYTVRKEFIETSVLGKSSLYVGFKTDEYRHQQKEMAISILLTTVLLFILGIIVAYFYSRLITRPLVKLSNVAKQIGDENIDISADESNGGLEISHLAAAFNLMVKKIRESQQELIREMAKYNESLDKQNKSLKNANQQLQNEINERKKVETALKENERLLQTTIDTAPAVINFVDNSHRILMTNQLFSEISGKSREEIIGKDVKEFVPKQYAEIMISKFKETIKTKSAAIFDYKIITDNVTSYYLSTISPHFSEDGEIQGIVNVAIDITKIKEAEKEVRESEKKFRTLTESARDGIIIICGKGRVNFWNKGAERIFGYTAEEVVGKDLHDLIAPKEFHEKARKGLQVFKENGTGYLIGNTVEFDALNKDDDTFPIELSMSSVQLNDEWHAFSIVRDITERKEMESDLHQAKEQAETANKAKSEFLANMSHEIRTPMNAILGFSQLLLNKIEGDQYRSYVEAIASSGKSLLSLINDILDLSKIEAGRLELDYEAVNIHSIFKEIENIFSFKISENGLEFIKDIDQNIPQGLILDEIRLRQILVNLVGNALKFTKKGYIKISANKEYTEQDESKLHLTFSVEDTGIGIADDQKKVIFEAFRQQSGQSSRKYGGTGLGLAITKRLVEIMDGQITLESSPGQGSKFIVKLHDVAVSATLHENEDDEKISTDFKLLNPTILIVDDIEVNRKLIKEYFDDHDVTFFEAENGRQGIDIALEQLPDLILMDMKMPILDGYEATQEIRKTEKIKDIPIIALTASAMKGDEQKIKEAGCSGYLSKPVDRIALLKEVSKQIPDKIEHIDTTEEEASTINISEEIDLSKEDKAKAIEILEKEYLPRNSKLQQSLIIGELKKYADTLLKFTEEYNIPPIRNYAEKLISLADNFDIINLRKLLEKFTEILEKIKTSN